MIIKLKAKNKFGFGVLLICVRLRPSKREARYRPGNLVSYLERLVTERATVVMSIMLEARGDEGDTHFVAVGDLVLPVEVVPDVNHTVHPRDEEHPCPRGAKASAR